MVVQIPDNVTAQNATLGLDLQTGLLDAPGKALQEMWQVVATIPPMVGQLFAGTAPANSFVGPLGIYQVTGEVAQRGGLVALLELLGLLSLNLAVVNLLPFPALDGGRLVFVALEWLRGGKKIDPAKEGLVHLVGIAVLLGLMVLISFFDIQRFISGQPILP
jgi:regulator of sigma E protease